MPIKYPIEVATVAGRGLTKDLKKIFNLILTDYLLRFGVTISNPKPVSLALVSDSNIALGITYHSDQAILMQVIDPHLAGEVVCQYGTTHFGQVICHEMIHACQYLTGRRGMIVEGFNSTISAECNGKEKYLLDPAEVEARVLEQHYYEVFAKEYLDG